MSTANKRVLFIGGSMNQTRQVHQVSSELREVEAWFSPHYATGCVAALQQLGLAEFTVIGQKLVARCLGYLQEHGLRVDYGGRQHEYDLVVTSSDLVVPSNIRGKKVVLIQEGMTDPEGWLFELVRRVPCLPRWLAGTAVTGMSRQYTCFCVASEGYRDLFVRKGIPSQKIRVTGIPNFDRCSDYCQNSFPYRDYVLVCTSDLREKYRREDRRELIQRALRIASGRLLIFKLHPNEDAERATREISTWAPDALVFRHGSAEEMIANCQTFITRYSSTVFVALTLGKETICDLNVDELKQLLPLQHGQAAHNIATVCRGLLLPSRDDQPRLQATVAVDGEPLARDADESHCHRHDLEVPQAK